MRIYSKRLLKIFFTKTLAFFEFLLSKNKLWRKDETFKMTFYIELFK